MPAANTTHTEGGFLRPAPASRARVSFGGSPLPDEARTPPRWASPSQPYFRTHARLRTF